jgi:acetylornithine deacetylase/succinyl-diaminopimelate desuccinylase-like protein
MRFAISALIVLALPTTTTAEQPSTDSILLDVRAYRMAHGPEILQSFSELLSLPNVASDSENIRHNAEYLEQELDRRGVDAELWHQGGAPPVVYGFLDVGSDRTLGVYVHYDGQPVDPEEWAISPWTPTLFTAAIEDQGVPRPLPSPGEAIDPEWRLYARSAGDDKAPLAAIFAAMDAFNQQKIRPTSNLIFLFEGEEEAGSAHLGQYLIDHREALDVDLWLICDGPVHQSRKPQLVFGVRGYTGLELRTFGANRYLHSGHYGNWAPNPAQTLVDLLATMKDLDGQVLIEGFYDSTADVSDSEREAMAMLPAFDEQLRDELDLAATEAASAPLAERLLLPSFNIRGLSSAAVGDRARNVIPMDATVSIDIRLAKGNDPAEMLDRVEDHIRAQGFTVVREEPDSQTRQANKRLIQVTRREGYPAARTAMDLPIVLEVLEAAELAAGEPVLKVPTLGGSLPLYLFNDILETPLVVVPIANHDNNQHAPNENLRLANLWYGIDLMAALLTMPPTAETGTATPYHGP